MIRVIKLAYYSTLSIYSLYTGLMWVKNSNSFRLLTIGVDIK